MELSNDAEDRIQTVVFMRHAVAQHNVTDARTGKSPNLRDPSLTDPPLIDDGEGARRAGERIRQWWRTKPETGKKIELILCSPLSRCLQTAALAFLPGNNHDDEECQHNVTFACVENVREACGVHFPDRRRTKSWLAKQWPIVQFETEMAENDELWKPTYRETYTEIERRIEMFLTGLVRRPEENIVVVSHGVWIETLFRMYKPEVLDHGRKRVYNCEAYAVQCISGNGRFLRIQENVQQI